MTWKPVENAKSFAINKPPIVVFTLCLGFFTITMVSLAYYVKMQEIGNPGITQDWNTFLDHLSEVEFCATRNDTDDDIFTTDGKDASEGTGSHNSNILEYAPARNLSIAVKLTIRPQYEFAAFPYNVTHLMGTILGSQLQLQGSEAQEAINVTFEFSEAWAAALSCKKGRRCKPVEFTTCLTLVGSPSVFPTTRMPMTCNMTDSPNKEYFASWITPQAARNCHRGALIRTKHHDDPRLKPVLQHVADHSMINLHLLHTSYFMFVMIITILCYAIVKKPYKRPLPPLPEHQNDKKVSLLS